MEPEGTLLHSQAPHTFPCPESDKSSPLLEDEFYITFPFTHNFSK
jgi:hypothetical protein